VAPVCQALIATGQLDEAEQRLETTLATTRTSDMPHWAAMALKVRGQLHAARGDEVAARKDFDAAIAIFDDLGSRIAPAGATVVVWASHSHIGWIWYLATEAGGRAANPKSEIRNPKFTGGWGGNS
jgi:hypothetical protein